MQEVEAEIPAGGGEKGAEKKGGKKARKYAKLRVDCDRLCFISGSFIQIGPPCRIHYCNVPRAVPRAACSAVVDLTFKVGFI